MNVRCPACGEAVALAVGDTRLACAACGLATPVSRVGTEPGTAGAGVALVTLEADLTGMTLAGRKILERIGAGGMGTVYRADSDDGDVAIKVLRPGLGTDRAAVLARFAREAEALRRLEHPRVVRFLDHGEDKDIAYIVTELVSGHDLSATLATGRMSLAEIVDIFGQVCDGVAAAHAAGIVHRDLKPANILVGKTGGVKVADFGLAQLGSDTAITTLTRTDVAMGTFHYLAPEQRKDARTVDHRADIWALGVIFYEMLTGELPLGSFAPPSTKGPRGCDRRTDAIVHRALAPDPADRFATVAELGKAVRALVARPGTSRPWIAIAAGLVLTAGTVGAVALTGGGGADRPLTTAAVTIDAGIAIDAAVAVVIDAAPPDVAVVAAIPVDAAVPIDAAVSIVMPVIDPRPPGGKLGGKVTDGKVPDGKVTDGKVTDGKVTDGKVPVGKVPVGKLTLGKPTLGGKGKVPTAVSKPMKKPAAVDPVATICRSARRCCAMVKGANCGSYLEADAATCETALVDLRARATNAKQKAMCQ